MSDSDGKKTLGVRGPRSGNVKQSFSHGRTNSVVVETKSKKRFAVSKPSAAKPTTSGGSAGSDKSKRPAGINDAEMERRLKALQAAKAREADEQAARQAEERARQEERDRRRAEHEAKEREQREIEERSRQKAEDEERARKEAEEQRKAAERPKAAPSAQPAAAADADAPKRSAVDSRPAKTAAPQTPSRKRAKED
jgi:translation initiation factor IF-2